MGSHLPPLEQALARRADEVLHYVWDPIGVSKIPEARDEYHLYLMQVLGLLKSNASPETIAARLTKIATEEMGLTANPKNDLEAAHVLVRWRQIIDAKGA